MVEVWWRGGGVVVDVWLRVSGGGVGGVMVWGYE